jgi:hypothetical protein
MDEAIRARIDSLPADKKPQALAEYEERKKFFEEISQLPEAERRAKLEERFSQGGAGGGGRMESGMARRGAMQTAEQRTERYRSYLGRKEAAATK